MTKDKVVVVPVAQTSWAGEEQPKSWWARRSELEKKLIIALILSGGLIAGIAIYTLLNRPGIGLATVSCVTPECLQASAQIIAHIDESVDPCDDFFKFACGKFIENTHGDTSVTSVQVLEEKIKRQLAEILKEPISEDDHYSMKNQKEIFNACMNETSVELESFDVIKEILSELNGWPVVTGYKWKERLFDWTKMIYKLKRKGYPYGMLLNLDVIADPAEKNKHILQVSEPFVMRIKEEHKELYKTYMTDVAVKLGAEINRATIEMEKVLDFIERLNKVADKNDPDFKDPDFNYTAVLLSQKFKVQDFQDHNNEMDWLEFINSLLYPAANITSEDYVIFPKTEFLEAYFSLIYKTPKRIQANYIIWSLLQNLTPFLSKEIKQLHSNYTCITQEPSSTPKERYDFCTRMMSSGFINLPRNIAYARRYLPQEKREEIQELLGNIKSELKSLLTQTSWMDEESKTNSVEKAEEIVEIIGLPGDFYSDEVYEKFLIDDTIEEDETDGSFLSMILKRMRLQNHFMYSRINDDFFNTTNEEYLTFHQLTNKVNAMYSPCDNLIFLPVGILQGIFYNSDRPMYLNYGAIGSIIGHELTHGFSKDSSKYDKDGNEIKIWSEQTEKNYDEVSQCLVEDAESFDVEDTESTINGTLTLEENVADFTGVKLSYAAYFKWAKKHGQEPQLAGIDYTPNQLFWISAISYECYKMSVEKLEVRLERDMHAHNAFRATAPMRNNQDFAKDFNCPAGSNMNPSKKCQVY